MKRKALSLVELLVVLMIIAIVYTLALGSFQTLQDKTSKLSLANLKAYLFSLEYESQAEVVCVDACSRCILVLDGEVLKEIESFVDASVEVYSYDRVYGYTQRQERVYFNSEDIQEDVCFSFKIDSLGISSQVLVAYKKKLYAYTNYLSPTLVYDSLLQAQEAKEALVQSVRP